jgi:hypothetical protein
MDYIMGLKTHFKKQYPDYFVSGSLYFGYMDMTYFSFTPPSLKKRKLKIAVVFLHEAFRFEIWLGGVNKQVQKKYWKLINEYGWDQYNLVSPAKGIDSILENILVENPDFSDLDTLTEKIEGRSLDFIRDVEHFLEEHKV